MSTELWILVATSVVTVVAIGAALVAVRAVRRLDAATRAPALVREAEPPVAEPDARPVTDLVVLDAHESLEPRTVEGRLVVPPTQQQVVQTALGRPGVRLSIFVHGAAHALRAESRDRIAAVMRREFRRRRRERLQAGRRAVRATRPAPPRPSAPDEWVGS
jgi:hypothetical protein